MLYFLLYDELVLSLNQPSKEFGLFLINAVLFISFLVGAFTSSWDSDKCDPFRNSLSSVLYTLMWEFTSIFLFFQIVKAYLRRGTAREMLGYYKEAVDGPSYLSSSVYLTSISQY